MIKLLLVFIIAFFLLVLIPNAISESTTERLYTNTTLQLINSHNVTNDSSPFGLQAIRTTGSGDGVIIGPGFVGQGMSTTADSNYLSMPNPSTSPYRTMNKNFTFSTWANVSTSLNKLAGIFATGTDGNDHCEFFFDDRAGQDDDLTFSCFDDAFGSAATFTVQAPQVFTDTYNLLTVVLNQTGSAINMYAYINETIVGSTSGGFTLEEMLGIVTIGTYRNGGGPMHLDEQTVFNRSLNSDEIAHIWDLARNGSHLGPDAPVIQKPDIYVGFNASEFIKGDVINFSANVTDDVDLAFENITYNISGSLTIINFTETGTSATISNVTEFTEAGFYTLTVYATDSGGTQSINETNITVKSHHEPDVIFINMTSEGDGNIVLNVSRDRRFHNVTRTNDTTPTLVVKTDEDATGAVYFSNYGNLTGPNMTACWTFDHNGTDGCGNNGAEELNGITHFTSSGKDRGGYKFDGENDRLFSPNMNTTHEITICIRNEPTGGGNAGNINQVLVSTRGTITGANINAFHIARQEGTNQFFGLFYNNSGTFVWQEGSVVPSKFQNLDSQYWCFTSDYLDAEDKTNITKWIDGEYIDSEKINGRLQVSNAGIGIGVGLQGSNNYFNGTFWDGFVASVPLINGELVDYAKNRLSPRMNYSKMVALVPERECSTTGTDIHTCTGVVNDTLEIGLATFCLGFKDAFGFENLTSSQCSQVNITDPFSPNATPHDPENNDYFLRGVNSTDINFTISALDNYDRNFTMELVIDGSVSITNSTYLNGTNVSYFVTIEGLGNHSWYVNLTDSFGNKNQSFTNYFTVDGLTNATIFLDGQNNSRKYELGFYTPSSHPFNINITITDTDGNGWCLDYDYFINWSCGTNETFLQNITVVNITQFHNGTSIQNLTASPDNISFNIPKESSIVNIQYRIKGHLSGGSYPNNIFIDSDGNGESDILLNGRLIDDTLQLNEFIYDSAKHNETNITFPQGGNEIIHMNSTSEFGVKNITLLLEAPEPFDFNNIFGYKNNFNETQPWTEQNETLSFGVTAPLGNFDDFSRNKSDIIGWDISTSATCSGSSPQCCLNFDFSAGEMEMLCSSGPSSPGTSASFTWEQNDTRIDLRKNTQVVLFYRHSASSSGGGDVSYTVRAYDGSSTVDLYSSTAESALGYQNLTLKKISDHIWKVLINGTTHSGGTDISSLNQNNQIKIQFFLTSSGTSEPDQSASVTATVDSILASGIWLNISQGNYSSRGNFTSRIINVTPEPLNRILLTATDEQPTGTNIDYYASNNCNLTNRTFELVTSGAIHTFLSAGQHPCYRTDLNTSNNATTPVVYSVDVEVISGQTENITVDFGVTGTNNWEFLGVFNDSNSPMLVNGTPDDLVSYRFENCVGERTCSYPISIGTATGGIIAVLEANITHDVGRINVSNLTAWEDENFINISFLFAGGIVEVYDLAANYLGNKNITLFLHTNVSTFSLENFRNITLQIIRSKFNKTLPYTFTDKIVPLPRNGSAKNVSPFGQTTVIPILNITGEAGENFDIGFRRNETIQCVDTKISNTSNVSKAINLTTIFNETHSNLTKSGSQGHWLFFDYKGCNGTDTRFYRPELDVQTCCIDCAPCWGFPE